MKKCVFYGRYSSVMQNEQSIEGQLHVCRQYAEQNGIEIVGEYIDRAVSGTTDKRPEFQRMINDSEKGIFDCIIVYKLDRFARNRYYSTLYKKKLRDNGVQLISATEQFTDTPEGILMEAVIEGFDEFYSAELGRKLQRGREMSFRKGKFVGRMPPYGYKLTDGRLAVDELTAPIVREIFERYANGEKQAQIVTDLNNRHIRNSTGNKWIKGNLSYMFKNKIYKGIYTHGKIPLEMPCPAIISEELFEKVQKEKANSIHRARESKTGYDYILTGHTTCAKCGAAVCGVSMAHGKYHYYQCHKHCGHRLSAEILHERVLSAIGEYLTDDKLEELAEAAYAEYSRDDWHAERELLEKEYNETEKKLKNAVNAILNGVDSLTLKDTIKQLETEKAELFRRMNEVSAPAPKFSAEQFRFSLEYIIETAHSSSLKKIINTFVNRIILDDDRIIICINLTDNECTPPFEQIMLSVQDNSTY
ncbi:MAG: recombinase family protein [Ruminococcus sp.]|nr:recombinase family protein [Ruminococcus sp.]